MGWFECYQRLKAKGARSRDITKGGKNENQRQVRYAQF